MDDHIAGKMAHPMSLSPTLVRFGPNPKKNLQRAFNREAQTAFALISAITATWLFFSGQHITTDGAVCAIFHHITQHIMAKEHLQRWQALLHGWCLHLMNSSLKKKKAGPITWTEEPTRGPFRHHKRGARRGAHLRPGMGWDPLHSGRLGPGQPGWRRRWAGTGGPGTAARRREGGTTASIRLRRCVHPQGWAGNGPGGGVPTFPRPGGGGGRPHPPAPGRGRGRQTCGVAGDRTSTSPFS